MADCANIFCSHWVADSIISGIKLIKLVEVISVKCVQKQMLDQLTGCKIKSQEAVLSAFKAMEQVDVTGTVPHYIYL